MAHADIFDQPDRLTGFFWGSIALHAAIAAAVIVSGVTGGPHVRWGSKSGGGLGAVAVNTVSQIPLPAHTGPENPVANPTESQAPTPPPQAKPAPKPALKAKAPAPDAIPLKTKSAPKQKPREETSASNQSHEQRQQTAPPNKWREQQKDLPNQLYSTGGQAMSSPMFGKAGSGGLGIGDKSPFGEQLGWYANQLQDKVAQHWKTDEVPSQIRTAPQVVISFTIGRDGKVVGVPQVKQSSGLLPLDRSAQRAVLESSPFPPIPAAFTRNQADIELTFELRR
jgi:protein TonB